MNKQLLGWASLLLLVAGPASGEQLWTDASGKYTTEAALVDYDGANVVLKNTSGKVVSLPVEKLSMIDQEFLKTQAAFMAAPKPPNENRVWTLRDGTNVVGQVLDYVQNHVVIQRQMGKILVNGEPFKKLPRLQQQVACKLIEFYDHVNLKDYAALERWAIRQESEPRDFLCKGVLMEVPDGDKIAVPFFLFSIADEEFLKPGWEQWLAKEKIRQDELLARETSHRQTELLSHIRARDYQRDEYERKMLELNTIQAGILSQWVVQLYPTYGNPNPPLRIFVPARTSQGAKYYAAMNHPGYAVGPIAKTSGWW